MSNYPVSHPTQSFHRRETEAQRMDRTRVSVRDGGRYQVSYPQMVVFLGPRATRSWWTLGRGGWEEGSKGNQMM